MAMHVGFMSIYKVQFYTVRTSLCHVQRRINLKQKLSIWPSLDLVVSFLMFCPLLETSMLYPFAYGQGLWEKFCSTPPLSPSPQLPYWLAFCCHPTMGSCFKTKGSPPDLGERHRLDPFLTGPAYGSVVAYLLLLGSVFTYFGCLFVLMCSAWPSYVSQYAQRNTYWLPIWKLEWQIWQAASISLLHFFVSFLGDTSCRFPLCFYTATTGIWYANEHFLKTRTSTDRLILATTCSGWNMYTREERIHARVHLLAGRGHQVNEVTFTKYSQTGMTP